jgi:hypothetical protein
MRAEAESTAAVASVALEPIADLARAALRRVRELSAGGFDLVTVDSTFAWRSCRETTAGPSCCTFTTSSPMCSGEPLREPDGREVVRAARRLVAERHDRRAAVERLAALVCGAARPGH